MNAQAAMKLANAWLEAHGEQTQSYLELRHPLIQVLQETVPDSARTGVGLIEAKPKVLALEADLLIVLDLVRLDDRRIREELRVLPLDPRPGLKFLGDSESGEQRGPGQRLTRARIWTIQPNVGEPVEVHTNEVIWDPFPSDAVPDSGELLMRALAAQIGWAIDGSPI
jgi:hypothetical protein